MRILHILAWTVRIIWATVQFHVSNTASVARPLFATRSSLIGCAIRSALNGSFPKLERIIVLDFLNHHSKLQTLINHNALRSICNLNEQNIESLDGVAFPLQYSTFTSTFPCIISLKNNYLRNLRGFKSVSFCPTFIDLSGNQIREFHSFELMLYPRHPFTYLSHLTLDRNGITSHVLRKYFDFSSLPSLMVLSLRNNSITTLHDVHFPFLESLDLSLNPISDLTNYSVEVHDLILCCNGINTKMLRSFEMTKSHIQSLNLMDNEIDDLSQIVFPKTLQILSMDGNPIRKCIQIQHSWVLQQLYVTNAGLTENELKSLLPPGFLRDLTILDLTRNQIQSIDAIHFPPNLRRLVLSGNRIRNLKDTALPPRLAFLYLNDNLLRNNDKNRMRIRFPDRLQHLELQNNAIHSLRGVELPENLMHLCLNSNGITDWMLYKMQFKIPQKLSMLSLRMNRLSSLTVLKISTRIRAETVSLDGNNLESGCLSCKKSNVPSVNHKDQKSRKLLMANRFLNNQYHPKG